MSAETLPGVAGDDQADAEAWPTVATPGGLVAQNAAPVAPSSPPATGTAGPRTGRVAQSVDPIGRPLPGHAKRPPVGTLPQTSAPGAPGAFDVCRAPRCRVKIRWAKTDSGDSIPVDYAPDPGGNLVRFMRAPGDWRVRELGKGETPDPSLSRWTSHYTTCPESTRFRSRGPGRRPTPAPAPAAAVRPVLAAVPAPPGVLLAVDGNSLAHRAYHAYERSAMRNSDGRPVWAVYGFLALLAGVLDRVRPDALVVGFDDRTACARRDRYAEYKSGRPERSPDLYAQLDDIVAVLADLGVTVIVPPGLEADDVLGSAAATAERAGWRCVAATSDKDAFGLITDTTTVLRLVSGLDNAVEMTPPVLLEQYGVTPGQWRDYTALVGDTSDNLPGVTGIGPKTAVKLLAACGTLDAAVADPDAARTAVGKAAAGKLATVDAATAITRNRDLMAAVVDVPVNLDRCRPTATVADVAVTLRLWQLPALIERVTAALCPPPAEPARPALTVAPAGPAAAPGPVLRSLPAPALAELGAAQDDAVRTCPACGLVCAARLPLAGDLHGAGVLVAETAMLGDLLMVQVGGRWAVERISGYVGDLNNRRRGHACRTYTGTCVTPAHVGVRARLYPGGWFCDDCAGQARGART